MANYVLGDASIVCKIRIWYWSNRQHTGVANLSLFRVVSSSIPWVHRSWVSFSYTFQSSWISFPWQHSLSLWRKVNLGSIYINKQRIRNKPDEWTFQLTFFGIKQAKKCLLYETPAGRATLKLIAINCKTKPFPEGITVARSDGTQRSDKNCYAANVVSNQRLGYQNVLERLSL